MVTEETSSTETNSTHTTSTETISTTRGLGVVIVTGFPHFLGTLLKGMEGSPHQCVAVITREGATQVEDMARELQIPVHVLPNCVSLEKEIAQNPESNEAVTKVIDSLKAQNPDVLVSWGFQILPVSIIDIASTLAVNFHSAELPRYRGGMSIQAQIMEGEEFLKLSLHELNAEIDAGAIVAQSEPLPISGITNTQALGQCTLVAGQMLLDTLNHCANGTLQRLENRYQQEDVPHAWGIKRIEVENEDGSKRTKNIGYLGYLAIDWDIDSGEGIERASRAFDTMGGPFTNYNELLMQFLQVEIVSDEVKAQPGEVIEVTGADELLIQARDCQVKCKVFVHGGADLKEAMPSEDKPVLKTLVTVSQFTGLSNADR